MANFSTRKIPHQAVITLTGIVYEQLQDGSINPVPKHIEEKILTNVGTTEKECADEMTRRMGEIVKQLTTNKNTQDA